MAPTPRKSFAFVPDNFFSKRLDTCTIFSEYISVENDYLAKSEADEGTLERAAGCKVARA